jgi:1-pyrroline-5-carboxylate dehydrogenase
MSNGFYNVKQPKNEQILSYKIGSKEREELNKELSELKKIKIEIPLIINGEEIFTGNTKEVIIPHKKEHVLAKYHMASKKELNMAIDSAMETKKKWERMPWQHRVSIFLKAAELLSGPWRAKINAATMLGQSKTIYQAEIDSACELIDFFRFNAYYLTKIYSDQPNSTVDTWNRMDYRPLEGFVVAITPFNFTSIGGNLPTAPAIMGNTCLWKPANTAVYSNYFIMKLLEEAGLPKGVINFVPSEGSMIGDVAFSHKDFGGVHFTGSTKVFNIIWKNIGNNIDIYKSYPRIVGETGGKDFIFAHKEADEDKLVAAMVRGAFEYQGQKCSAASRAYIPQKMWNQLEEIIIKEVESIRVGDIEDSDSFMGAVIDKRAFDKIKTYIEFAKTSNDAKIIAGGNCNDEEGFFIEPTVILTTNPKFKTMVEEIFGPVLTIYVYQEEDFEKTLNICDQSTEYGLTGSIFSRDKEAIVFMEEKLRHTAGNIYINDKPTGAVVGQQPFGGARASGTNDKAGSMLNLLRWVSPRVIKESYNAPSNYRRKLN